MKTKIFYLIVFVFFIMLLALGSFTFTKNDKTRNTAAEKTMQFHSRFLFSDSSHVAYFECEDFASNALTNYTITTMTQKFSGHCYLFKKYVVNRHDNTVVDTIYTFSNPGNRIQIYRAKQNDFIFTFEVKDSLFTLIGDVKTGMTKDAFSSKFRITEPIINMVQIENAEKSMRFMFYFENDRLKQIGSYLYLD